MKYVPFSFFREKFGSFEYALPKTPYDINNKYDSRKVKFKPVQPQQLNKKPKYSDGEDGSSSSTEVYNKGYPKSTEDVKLTDKKQLAKTVSALKNKYNSIITTRRAAGIKVPVKKYHFLPKKKKISRLPQKTEILHKHAKDSVSGKESTVPSGVFTISTDIDPDVKNIKLCSDPLDETSIPKPKLPEPDIIKKLEVAIKDRDKEEESEMDTAESVTSLENEDKSNNDKNESKGLNVSDSANTESKSVINDSDKEKRSVEKEIDNNKAECETGTEENDKEKNVKKSISDSTTISDSNCSVGVASKSSICNISSVCNDSSSDDKKEGSFVNKHDNDGDSEPVETKDLESEAVCKNGDMELGSPSTTSQKSKHAKLEDLVASCKAKLGLSEVCLSII